MAAPAQSPGTNSFEPCAEIPTANPKLWGWVGWAEKQAGRATEAAEATSLLNPSDPEGSTARTRRSRRWWALGVRDAGARPAAALKHAARPEDEEATQSFFCTNRPTLQGPAGRKAPWETP